MALKSENGSKLLLGFDARERWDTFKSDWSEGQKQLYLLRSNVIQVLSVDCKVWPSIFLRRHLYDQESIVPEYRYLWDNLTELSASAADISRPGKSPFSTVAVALMTDTSYESQINEWRNAYPEPEPSEIQADWRFLGYDIADKFFLSGLSNCGYNENKSLLQSQWESRLNDYHLFIDIASANHFKLMTNQRAREHAPFYVFGIWLIDSVNRSIPHNTILR